MEIEKTLNVKEAASFLSISPVTLARRVKERGIGHYRVGKRLLFSKSDHLVPFLESCECKPLTTGENQGEDNEKK